MQVQVIWMRPAPRERPLRLQEDMNAIAPDSMLTSELIVVTRELLQGG